MCAHDRKRTVERGRPNPERPQYAEHEPAKVWVLRWSLTGGPAQLVDQLRVQLDHPDEVDAFTATFLAHQTNGELLDVPCHGTRVVLDGDALVEEPNAQLPVLEPISEEPLVEAADAPEESRGSARVRRRELVVPLDPALVGKVRVKV